MARKRVNRRIVDSDLVKQSISHRLAQPVAALLLLLALGLIAVDRMFQPTAFQVDQISYVSDFRHVTREELVRTVNPTVKGNLLSLDLHAIENVAESLPWVDTVNVRRRFPDTIRISVIEHAPVARWGDGGWVTAKGTVISDPNALVTEALPLFQGPAGFQEDLLRRHRDWGRILSNQGLVIEKVDLSERGAWTLRVRVRDEGYFRPLTPVANTDGSGLDQEPVVFDVTVGRNNADERIARFSRVYRHSLLPQVIQVERVDLRHTNGFSVQWIKPDEPEMPVEGSTAAKQQEA